MSLGLGPRSNRVHFPLKLWFELLKSMRPTNQNHHKSQASASAIVCIVDDDVSMAESTRYLISSFGFQAKAFTSAQEFLSSSIVDDAQCLILDVRMPGMDGLELQHYLAQADKRISIVFVTAHADDREERKAREAGAVDFLRKPFSEEALFNAIKAALNRYQRLQGTDDLETTA